MSLKISWYLIGKKEKEKGNFNGVCSIFQARQDAARVVANLQRQRVNSRLIASDYLEKNIDLMDILIPG